MESEAAAQCSVCQELLEALVLTALPWKVLGCGDQAFFDVTKGSSNFYQKYNRALQVKLGQTNTRLSSFLTLCVYSTCNENKRGMLNIENFLVQVFVTVWKR